MAIPGRQPYEFFPLRYGFMITLRRVFIGDFLTLPRGRAKRNTNIFGVPMCVKKMSRKRDAFADMDGSIKTLKHEPEAAIACVAAPGCAGSRDAVAFPRRLW